MDSSWWPAWQAWLLAQGGQGSGEQVAAPWPPERDLGDAPGTYVLER